MRSAEQRPDIFLGQPLQHQVNRLLPLVQTEKSGDER